MSAVIKASLATLGLVAVVVGIIAVAFWAPPWLFNLVCLVITGIFLLGCIVLIFGAFLDMFK